MGPGGALEAAVEAREQGLVRFIGVTGHGLAAPAMHRRSLERFDFDSVLFPVNYPMMQNERYAADVEALISLCEERNVAIQTIKSITQGPWATTSVPLDVVPAAGGSSRNRPGGALGTGSPGHLPEYGGRYPCVAESA